MTKFKTIAAVAAMLAASATSALAGNPVPAEDPYIAPAVPASSSGSLGGGAGAVIAGVAAAAVLAAAVSDDSDTVSTHAHTGN